MQLNVWRVIGIGDAGPGAGEPGAPRGRVRPGGARVPGRGVQDRQHRGHGAGPERHAGTKLKAGRGHLAVIAILVFLVEARGTRPGPGSRGAGAVMILMMLYVAIVAAPPVGEALKNTVVAAGGRLPAITTLIGGTVGGTSPTRGAHRMIHSGHRADSVRDTTRTSAPGILVTCVMRVLLFLAIFGEVASGVALAWGTPWPRTPSRAAAGEIGVRIFGSGAVGRRSDLRDCAAFTPIRHLLRGQSPHAQPAHGGLYHGVRSDYLVLAGAETLLVFAARRTASSSVRLRDLARRWVWRRRDLLQGYRYPGRPLVVGVIAWLFSVFLAVNSRRGPSRAWARLAASAPVRREPSGAPFPRRTTSHGTFPTAPPHLPPAQPRKDTHWTIRRRRRIGPTAIPCGARVPPPRDGSRHAQANLVIRAARAGVRRAALRTAQPPARAPAWASWTVGETTGPLLAGGDIRTDARRSTWAGRTAWRWPAPPTLPRTGVRTWSR
ncbi:hypothetical protein QJS66_12205 [Kocuria rhizophila]|nr:hypothetical protein QJS66_12205 [Kocuria rhizophila]